MVLESHNSLVETTGAEVIVLEGAGSCTEMNLMERDIVNLPLVRELGCPWLLVANIDCGGVFAQIVGTKVCVSEHDWSLCVGVIVNKLRGEAKHFEPGPKMLEVCCCDCFRLSYSVPSSPLVTSSRLIDFYSLVLVGYLCSNGGGNAVSRATRDDARF
jgi:hypothetical protein